MKRYYYTDQFKTEGKVLGPVSVQELKRLHSTQQITEECLVCLEGTEDWEPLAQAIKKFNNKASFLLKKQRNLFKKKKRDEKKETVRDWGFGAGVVILWIVMVVVFIWIYFFGPDALKYSVSIIFLICLGIGSGWKELRQGVLSIIFATVIIGGGIWLLAEIFFIPNPEPKRVTFSWAGKNIIGVEKVTTESRLKPSIGVIGGRKPRTGIVGTYERGSTKYKVTYEDDNGIIRTVTTNKDPTRD